MYVLILIRSRLGLLHIIFHAFAGLENSTRPVIFTVTQAAGQVKILIFLVKIENFPIHVNNFCDAGQVPIFRYFKT